MYQEVFEEIKKQVIALGYPTDQLKMAENKSYWSIYYSNTLICSVTLNTKSQYVTFDSKYLKDFENRGCDISQTKSDSNHFRLHINYGFEIEKFSSEIQKIIKSIRVPKTFDICSRYMQCSDARRCVHPDLIHAKECSYKEKLENGIIFYGKNRNV